MTVIKVVICLYRVDTESTDGQRLPLPGPERVQVSADIIVMLFVTCFCSRLTMPMELMLLM